MGWKITATTLKCEYVDDFATVLVKADATAKCSYVVRYSKAKNAKQKMKNCKWPDCPLVNGFRDQAMALP